MKYVSSDKTFFYKGLVNSRLEREWCLKVPRCIDPELICQDLEADFLTARKLHEEKKRKILYDE